MKRAAKSFSYNRTVHVIWIRFALHFQSRVKLLSRIQWPTHGSGHPSNQPLRIHVSATSVADSSSDSKRCFLQLLFFVTWSIHLVAASYSATSLTSNRTIFENRITSQMQQRAIITMTLKTYYFFLVQLRESRLSLFVYHSFIELKKIIVIICNSFRHW